MKKNKDSNIHIIDSTFIMNKYGTNYVARNKFFKNKNCNKISLMTDNMGIPISVLVNSGNIHDINFIEDHMKDLHYYKKNNKFSGKIKTNKRYPKNMYFLADKAYESKKMRDNLSKYNYKVMIPAKKNAKTKYEFDKTIYKKRNIVENTFSKIKTFRRVNIRYDKLLNSFSAFVYLGAALLTFNGLIMI